MVSIGGGTFIPTSLQMCSSTGLLWMVTGVSNLRGSECPSLARVRVISGLNKSNSDSDTHEHQELEDNEIPGGTSLLKNLQGSLSYGEEVFLAAAEALKTAMSHLLVKKQYSNEKREFRKRTRNDKKIKPRKWWDLACFNLHDSDGSFFCGCCHLNYFVALAFY